MRRWPGGEGEEQITVRQVRHRIRISPRRKVAAGAILGTLALLVAGAAPADAYPRPGATERFSVASDGIEANNASAAACSVSADGRFVAFSSVASNLVPGDTNGAYDIFVHDRQTGTTQRVSVASNGGQANSASFSYSPALSADGRYVAFQSFATNLVPGDTNGATDAFVHDRQTGTTERVSVASDGTQANSSGLFDFPPSISADGRLVAFSSVASNLVPGDTNGVWDVFVHDRQTGTTERVSVASDGTQASSSSAFLSSAPAISADGRHVAFTSVARNLVPGDTNEYEDVFVHDRQTGTTERVSIASDGTQSNNGASSFSSAVSADGRQVTFSSFSTNLVPGDMNGAWDVFVHDRQTGTTERVSVASDGTEANNSTFSSSSPAISADGRHVAFENSASNLVPGDTNGAWDVFVHDRQTGTTERVSVASDGTEADNGSPYRAAVSADGRQVVFPSLASNLVPSDANGAIDVFVHDLGHDVWVFDDLSALTVAGGVGVSGRAAFTGATMTEATDPGDDGTQPEELGVELTGAELLYRVEQEDLLLRLNLASLPPVAAGLPGVVFGLELTAGTTRFEVRALRAGATSVPPAAPYVALYQCAPGCSEEALLKGAFGSTGDEVTVAIPLSALGVSEGTALSDLRAFTALGEAALGKVVPIDNVQLTGATIPSSQVELGIAPSSAPLAEVPFSVQADLAGGQFSGTVDASSLPPGDYRVWAQACLGSTCGARWAAVEV